MGDKTQQKTQRVLILQTTFEDPPVASSSEQAECVAVTSVVDMANAAVEEGIALWYKLIIQGERFDVDEATLMMVRAAFDDLSKWFSSFCHSAKDGITLSIQARCKGGAVRRR
jgi:hypothetical protein